MHRIYSNICGLKEFGLWGKIAECLSEVLPTLPGKMKQTIARISVLVDDYDEAIKFYTRKLKFILLEDTQLSETKRWVVVAPKGSEGCNLLLAKAVNDEQKSRIGNQAGGRVFLFLFTDDFQQAYQNLLDQSVTIIRQASQEVYGRVAVFADLYGNLWDLVEPSDNRSGL